MTLRDQAAAHVRKSGYLGALDGLIAALDDPDVLADVMDLLTGDPPLSSRVVAVTLNEAFDVRVSAEMVRRWRVSNT